ncbi:MAG: shikimate kinase [Candidatus Altiarchaeota archaeon]|nr:shikimate kinase [Candidatus Altiarchaeota archaeon]MBU4406463.1 shikimate kinase [Candidatus Altiarchaeota archaeon]MBU4437405.1 shikimate kinase [Candidatus Altiarchaeota archaeon]
MKTTAIAHGAVTLVNAIATGKGAAFGISLETRAMVELNDSGKISARIKDFPDEDTKLIELCSKKVLEFLGVDYGVDIETESNIPPARGLKSSSAAANAAVLAVAGAIGGELPDDLTLINLGIDAALEAKVTITGAFDDATASYFGGYVVTDNMQRKLMKSGQMEQLKVLLFVPDEKTYTQGVDVEMTKRLAKGVDLAWGRAMDGKFNSALTLNGLVYSATLGQTIDTTLAAIDAGAIAAGLCGTGPAVSALTKDDPGAIKDAWKEFPGEIIETDVNNEKAKILK